MLFKIIALHSASYVQQNTMYLLQILSHENLQLKKICLFKDI